MKIALLDAAILDRDLAEQRGADSENGRALELRLYRIRVHDHPTIHGAHDSLHGDTAGRSDRDLGDLGDVASEGVQQRNPAAASRRQWPTPARLLRRQREHPSGAGRSAEKGAAVCERVLFGQGCELVDEALDGKGVARRPHGPPKRRRDTSRLLARVLHQDVGKLVRRIRCTVHGIDIDAPKRRDQLVEPGGPQDAQRLGKQLVDHASEDRRAGNGVSPGNWEALAV